jgi:hypothetical protein
MNVLITGTPLSRCGFNWPAVGTVMQVPEQLYNPYFMTRIGAPLLPAQTALRITWAQFTGGGGQAVNDE